MLRRDSIAKILQINVRVSSSLGHPYIIQLAAIYERMLQARPFHCCTRKTLVDAQWVEHLAEHRPGIRLHRTWRLLATTDRLAC